VGVDNRSPQADLLTRAVSLQPCDAVLHLSGGRSELFNNSFGGQLCKHYPAISTSDFMHMYLHKCTITATAAFGFCLTDLFSRGHCRLSWVPVS